MQRIRNLSDQRFIAPSRTLLDDHQPHEALDRDRRPPEITRRLIPRRLDRRQQRRIVQQPIQRREIRRQLAHLNRQSQIKQRLHLTTRQPQHPILQIHPICRTDRLKPAGQNGHLTRDYFRGK
jgi:hypothetical protein